MCGHSPLSVANELTLGVGQTFFSGPTLSNFRNGANHTKHSNSKLVLHTRIFGFKLYYYRTHAKKPDLSKMSCLT